MLERLHHKLKGRESGWIIQLEMQEKDQIQKFFNTQGYFYMENLILK